MTSLKIAFMFAAAASAGLSFGARADAGNAVVTIATDNSATATVQPEIGDVKACAVPNKSARVDGTAYVDYPLFAQGIAAEGTAIVQGPSCVG